MHYHYSYTVALCRCSQDDTWPVMYTVIMTTLITLRCAVLAGCVWIDNVSLYITTELVRPIKPDFLVSRHCLYTLFVPSSNFHNWLISITQSIISIAEWDIVLTSWTGVEAITILHGVKTIELSCTDAGKGLIWHTKTFFSPSDLLDQSLQFEGLQFVILN